MTTGDALITVLLRGHSYSSAEGSLGYCGVYLVESRHDGGTHRVLFDSAHAGRRRALIQALASRGLGTGDIDVVVLSHAHYDHVQNVDLFARARVLLHDDELRGLDHPDPDELALPPWTAAILRGLDVHGVSDGEIIVPGVRIVALPGHTPGSIGLAAGTAQGIAMLTGDAVSSAAALRAGQASSVRDADKGAASVRRVLETADVVYPGHDRPFRIVRAVPDGSSAEESVAGESFGIEYLVPADPLVFRTGNPGSVPLETAGDAG